MQQGDREFGNAFDGTLLVSILITLAIFMSVSFMHILHKIQDAYFINT
jgi:hypothetical protein